MTYDRKKVEAIAKLSTTAGDLTFELVVDHNEAKRDMAEKIVVIDGEYRVSSYCLDPLEKNNGEGMCVTGGAYEKYREIEGPELIALCTEARAALARAKE